MRTKDKNNYTINEDVFDFEDNTKNETVSAWKQVLIGTIIEKNGYNYSKICFIYYPATDYDSEEIVVFFKDSDEWYRFKDGMTFKWKLPENLRKKIRETN